MGPKRGKTPKTIMILLSRDRYIKFRRIILLSKTRHAFGANVDLKKALPAWQIRKLAFGVALHLPLELFFSSFFQTVPTAWKPSNQQCSYIYFDIINQHFNHCVMVIMRPGCRAPDPLPPPLEDPLPTSKPIDKPKAEKFRVFSAFWSFSWKTYCRRGYRI